MYSQLSITPPTNPENPIISSPLPAPLQQSVEDRLSSLENQMKEMKKLVSEKKKPKKNNQIFQTKPTKPKNSKKKEKKETPTEPPKIQLPQLLKFDFDPPQFDSYEIPKFDLPTPEQQAVEPFVENQNTEPQTVETSKFEFTKIKLTSIEPLLNFSPTETQNTDSPAQSEDSNSKPSSFLDFQELNKSQFEIIKDENITDAWEFVDEEMKDKLNLLSSMGFHNMQRNYELLLQFENVDEVIEELLDA